MKKDHYKYHSIKTPNLLGDKKSFQDFIAKNLVYPQSAIENKIEGVAHIKCEISDKGNVLKVESLHKLGYGLDEEAERLCMLLKFENTTERGLRIKHYKTIRIPFIIPQQLPITINYETSSSSQKGVSYNYTLKI